MATSLKNHDRKICRKYNFPGPQGTYPRPKRPWEMTDDELAAERAKQKLEDEMQGFGHSSLPLVVGPPPPQPIGGGVYSFGTEPEETDLVGHMRRIRKRTNSFVPHAAFRR